MAAPFAHLIDEALQAVTRVETFIESVSLDYKKWYIGLTDDLDRRLAEHNAQNPAQYTHVNLSSFLLARVVKAYLTQNHDTMSEDRGGNARSTTVYAFLMTPETDPSVEAADIMSSQELVALIQAIADARQRLAKIGK